MKCATMKADTECLFMSKNGCSFNGGKCHPVVEQCQGCNYVVSFPTAEFCKTYGDPRIKWSDNRCNFATHLQVDNGGNKGKKLNPLKASKRNQK